ncbi:hypothetical protein EDB86DRAFT_3140335 [Lactarius hatsudake]|nr:hypothetical protein EDB86DRAFT_3140335 [Lactarius hatsudake]
MWTSITALDEPPVGIPQEEDIHTFITLNGDLAPRPAEAKQIGLTNGEGREGDACIGTRGGGISQAEVCPSRKWFRGEGCTPSIEDGMGCPRPTGGPEEGVAEAGGSLDDAQAVWPYGQVIGETPQNAVCRTQADLLTKDGKVVMGSAICMFCGLKYREKNSDTTDNKWYEKCISDELDEITLLYEKPQYKNDMHKLWTHPIITYVGDKWLRATDKGRELAIANIELADIFPLCNEGAIKHPLWNTQLHMKNLDVLVRLQKDEHKWWLPAKLLGDVAASHATPSAIAGLNMAPVSASVHDAPTVNEDIEMEDNGGETPRKKKVGKCPAVQSPTLVCWVSNRQCKADSGDAITLSSPESESGGLMSARLPPAVHPPTPCAPAEPAAERCTSCGEYISSGDNVKVPTAHKKCKRRESAIIDDSASELETGLTDPVHCAPHLQNWYLSKLSWTGPDWSLTAFDTLHFYRGRCTDMTTMSLTVS